MVILISNCFSRKTLMCLDYTKVDLKEITNELKLWIKHLNSKDFKKIVGKTEPLERHLKKYKPALGVNLQSIKTRHGSFIETSFYKWVRCIPDWDSILRPKITYNTATNKQETKEIDNISFNKRTGKLVVFELKRNYDSYYYHQEYAPSFYNRLNLYNRKITKIIKYVQKQTGYTVNEHSIVLINTYGTKKDWSSKVNKKGNFDPEILLGNDLGSIFGKCIVTFLDELDEFLVCNAFEKYSHNNELRSEGKINPENKLQRIIEETGLLH